MDENGIIWTSCGDAPQVCDYLEFPSFSVHGWAKKKIENEDRAKRPPENVVGM